jgi:anthranilate phosphoribosyltransferase
VRGQAGNLVEYTLTPEEVGLATRPREAVQGGDAQRNALLLRDVLSGELSGAPAELVALNAGAALYVAGQAESIADGARLAGEGLRAGRAIPTLEALVTTSRALAAKVG